MSYDRIMAIAESSSPTTSRLPHVDLLELARQRLIVALDVPDAASAARLVSRLEGTCTWFKVGLELFVAAGPAVLEPMLKQGHSIFLDLKFHDIPNTVAGAVRSAAGLGAKMMTVHAAGGPAMLEAARGALDGLANPPQLLAVTMLTSMDASQMRATGLERTPAEQVELLARIGLAAGMRGFVCSPQEVGAVRALTASGRDPGGSGHPADRLRGRRPETDRDARGNAARRSELPGGRPAHHAGDRSGSGGAGDRRRDGYRDLISMANLPSLRRETWGTHFVSQERADQLSITVWRRMLGLVKMSFSSMLRLENSETTAPRGPA